MQQQEIEKRVIGKEFDSLKSELGVLRQEFKHNDSILEKNLSDLIHDFKYYTQNTIKPAQLTEAKIFSMETKYKELENKNLHEHY